jgi:flagellin
MVINHNISAMITQGSLYRTNVSLGKNLEKLSTGLRINRASDDAAGLGVSEMLRTQVNGTAQARRNAQDGISAINIAEGAANEVSAILQRMRELAVQSSNDTLTATERGYTNQEFQALNDEINRIANVTNYNGMKLLAGTGATRFGNADGGVAGGSTASVLWVDANNVRGNDSITVTIDTLSNATGVGSGIGTANSYLTTQSSAVSAITTLDTAINSVNTMRSNMGALINRLEHAINNLTIANTNQQSAESAIRDVDFASETTQYTKNQILMQSGTAMLAQANTMPQSVLTLLGK